MLDFLRKRKRNWIIIFLLGLIILVFVAFYGGTNKGQQGATEVANINGEVITPMEFGRVYQREVERYREMLKGNLTEEMLKGLNLKGNVLEQMIQKKLVMQEARSLGLVATDDEVARHLEKVPEFHVAGRFNKDRYLQLLGANRLTPVQFEEDQREQLTLNRLYSVILDAAQVSEAEVRERYRLEQEKINLQYVKLSAHEFTAQVKLSDDDLKKFYERNKESFKEPLRVQVEYLRYPFTQFAVDTPVSEKEIDEFYQANLKIKFHKPDEVKVRYIAIPVASNADAAAQQAAQARASALVKEARRGKDFAQLAKKESSDPTAAKGGEVGWIAKGQMPPEVDKILFGTGKGDVTDPIAIPGGFQIFKIDDWREERTMTLKEATAEITDLLKTEKAKSQAGKVIDEDRAKAQAGTDFAKLAQERKVEHKTSALFAAGENIPEAASVPDFAKQAFALTGKDLSPILVAKDGYVMLKLKERKEPSIPPLDSVRAQVEKGAGEAKAYELALQKANSLLDQLRKEKDLAALAKANDLKVEETGWFLRNAPQLPKVGDLAELRGSALSLSAQKPVADKVFTQKDNVFLLAFKESQPADMDQFEREKVNLKKQALNESRQLALVKFLESLKAKAKIKFNNDFLESL